MRLHEIADDLRQQVTTLYNRLPTRWRNDDGGESWKDQKFLSKLPAIPEDELADIAQNFQQILHDLETNPQHRLSDPYRRRGSRAYNATLAALLSRVMPTRRFHQWLREFLDQAEYAAHRNDAKYLKSTIPDFIEDTCSMRIREDGLITFWQLDKTCRTMIGDLPIALYHFTSSKVLPSIRQHGLHGDRPSVNERTHTGVYLTTETSGPPIRGYTARAVAHHGGRAVMLTVKCYLSELRADPDDAAIQSGRTQFVVNHVPPDRIVAVERA